MLADDFNRIIRMWQKFFEEIERQIDEEFRQLIGPRRRPRLYYYGFEITVGPDGRPVVREFGNVKGRREGGGIEVLDEIEPLTDVVEDGEKIRVVAEVPGVEKDDIRVRVSEDNRLIINAQGKDRKYYKEVPLPAQVNPAKTKASYRNGVLTVELEKKDKERRGFEIKVE